MIQAVSSLVFPIQLQNLVLFIVFIRARDPAARARGSKPMKRWIVLAIVIAVASLLPLALDARGYWIRVLTFTLLFAAMAQAWNIVGGLANQLSLGHAAFFGIGAYTSTIL